MSVYATHHRCRLCRGETLLPVLDLGTSPLSGQFPLPGEPDPPAAPLEVVRCADPGCGLVQLRHTADRGLCFGKYHYRSSVSATMRGHLADIVGEAAAMLLGRQGPVCVAPRVLDVGSNDGTLLNAFPVPTGVRVAIDPSDVPVDHPGISVIKGYWPADMILNRQFDLVFSVACFYSHDDPLGWARAVKKVLSPHGLWCVEVADLSSVLRNVDVGYFCHEHVGLYSAWQFDQIARRSALKVARIQESPSNGGSLRLYLAHENDTSYDGVPEWQARVSALTAHGEALARPEAADAYLDFARDAGRAADRLRCVVRNVTAHGGKVHLLAAGTKSGTILSHAGLTRTDIEAASDRDPRKVGRRMAGSGIEIVSEQRSREMRPDLYVCLLPASFRDEIVAREREAGTTCPVEFPLARAADA